MDANLVLPLCGWVLAETIRYAQKGAIDPREAAELVEGLVEKKYPAVEVVDGRVYLHAKRKSAVDVVLVALARTHPRRMTRSQLIAIARSNGFSRQNAGVAIGRIRKFVDEDESGMMRLLLPGLRKAEDIISNALTLGSVARRAE